MNSKRFRRYEHFIDFEKSEKGPLFPHFHFPMLFPIRVFQIFSARHSVIFACQLLRSGGRCTTDNVRLLHYSPNGASMQNFRKIPVVSSKYLPRQRKRFRERKCFFLSIPLAFLCTYLHILSFFSSWPCTILHFCRDKSCT